MLKRIKEFLQKINKQKFIRNLLISFALISAILIIGNFDITCIIFLDTKQIHLLM